MAEPIYIPEGYANNVLIWTVIGRDRPLTCTIGGYKPALGSALAHAEAVYEHATGAASIGNAASMSTLFTFQGVRTYYREDPTGELTAAEVIDPVVGTVNLLQEPISINNTLVVSKNTALVGRKFRGRCFGPITKVAESSINLYGQLVGSAQTDHQAMWNAFMALAATDDYSFVLLHGGDSMTRPLPTNITNFTVKGIIGSQRRRRGA